MGRRWCVYVCVCSYIICIGNGKPCLKKSMIQEFVCCLGSLHVLSSLIVFFWLLYIILYQCFVGKTPQWFTVSITICCQMLHRQFQLLSLESPFSTLAYSSVNQHRCRKSIICRQVSCFFLQVFHIFDAGKTATGAVAQTR